MKDVIFRLNSEDKKQLKARVALLGFSIQDYLTALVKLDQEKNLIKSIS